MVHPPWKLAAIFNSTTKVSIFSVDPLKVSKCFNSATPSIKTTMIDSAHGHFDFFFFPKCPQTVILVKSGKLFLSDL
jgi:hypothetical protein